MELQESSSYWALLEMGEEKHAQKVLEKLGKKRLGTPSEAQLTALKAITDLEQLDRLILRVLDVATWDELLAGE